MLNQAMRAARFGAIWTALVAIVATLALAFLVPSSQPEDVLLSGPMLLVPGFGVVGAVAGAVIFGLVGLVSAAIHVKPVGWTFVYSFFGAALAAAAAFLARTWSGTLSTASVADLPVGGSALLAALVGLIAGALVAASLKRARPA